MVSNTALRPAESSSNSFKNRDFIVYNVPFFRYAEAGYHGRIRKETLPVAASVHFYPPAPERWRFCRLSPVAELHQPGKGLLQDRLYQNGPAIVFTCRHKGLFPYSYGTQVRRGWPVRVKAEIPVRHEYVTAHKAGRRHIPASRQDSCRPRRRCRKMSCTVPAESTCPSSRTTICWHN